MKRAARAIGRIGQPLLDRWRRSLQFRVLVVTLGLSLLLLLVIVLGLIAQISQRLLDSTEESAAEDVARSEQIVVDRMLASPQGDLASRLKSVSDSLITSASGVDAPVGATGHVPVLMATPGNTRIQAPTTVDIPPGVERFVSSGQVAIQYVTTTVNGRYGRYLVVGTPTSTPEGVQLYHFYPLDEIERTMSLLRSTVLAGGFLLVILLGLIAFAVARQVVGPVREVSHTVEKFASGDLAERIRVTGEDELSILGHSFNRMAESISTQISQLEEFGDLQRRFTSDVSHELRTPLTTVRMAAELIDTRAESSEDPALIRSSRLMVRELDKFESLLSDLLEISRHDAGVAEFAGERIDIRACCQSALSSVEHLLEAAGADIVVDMPDSPLVAEVDSRRFERILRNLLANAIDHCEGRPIDVAVRGDDATVAFSVRDYGVGFTKEQAKLVFNRFWRADPSRKRRSGGTGLGLAISHEDAALHGGRLEAWGRPGEGACFRLTVPRRHGDRVVSSPLPLVVPSLQDRPSQRTIPDNDDEARSASTTDGDDPTDTATGGAS